MIDPAEHIGLVYMTCNRFAAKHRRLDDQPFAPNELVGYAYQAMHEAALRYKPEVAKWSTYAVRCMWLQLLVYTFEDRTGRPRRNVDGEQPVTMRHADLPDFPGEIIGRASAETTSDCAHLLDEAMRTLTENERHSLIRIAHGDTTTSISRGMGISRARVYELNKNARKKARAFLEMHAR